MNIYIIYLYLKPRFQDRQPGRHLVGAADGPGEAAEAGGAQRLPRPLGIGIRPQAIEIRDRHIDIYIYI